MRNPKHPSDEEQRRRDDTRVEQAVTAILKKLKRGLPVRLPGVGSLLPGAPPTFRSLSSGNTASSHTSPKKNNAKP